MTESLWDLPYSLPSSNVAREAASHVKGFRIFSSCFHHHRLHFSSSWVPCGRERHSRSHYRKWTNVFFPALLAEADRRTGIFSDLEDFLAYRKCITGHVESLFLGRSLTRFASQTFHRSYLAEQDRHSFLLAGVFCFLPHVHCFTIPLRHERQRIRKALSERGNSK